MYVYYKLLSHSFLHQEGTIENLTEYNLYQAISTEELFGQRAAMRETRIFIHM